MANEIVLLKLEVGTDGQIKGIEKLENTAKKSGEKSGEKFSDGFTTGLGGITKGIAKIATIAGGVLGAFSLKKAIDNASEAEDALNSFNNSLIITGKYTKQASDDFQSFASSLQANSKYGDDIILQNASIIQSLANLDSQGLKRATQASADFASAMSIDIGTASSLVGKAMAGNVGALSRYGIKVEEGATKSQTLANVLTVLETKFGGSAQNQLKTFSGALEQTTNTFGDLLEEIGFVIIRQPLLIEGLKILNGTFQKSIISVQNFAKSFSLFNDVIAPILNFNDLLITFVISPIELVGNVAIFTFNKIAEGVSALVAVIGQAGGGIAQGLESLGISNEFTQGLKDFGETSTQVFTDFANKSQESFQSILDFPFATGLANKNAEILEQTKILNDNLKIGNDELKNNIINNSQQVTDAVVQDIGTLNLGFANFKLTFDNTAETIKKTQQQLAQQFKAGLVNGISGGIQNIVNSIANGENAFKNFGKFVLQTMGDMAIQMGQTLIGAGLGIEALKSLGGSAAIVAGAGLVALGAIMKSLAGGGGSTSNAGGAGAGNYANQAGPVTPATLSEPEDIEQRNVGPRVQLVVQGDILDSDQTANRILDLLNKNFSDNGGSFNGASFA
jgi:hypothetical protein